MKYILGVLVGIMLSVIGAIPVNAHVLLLDKNGNQGAIIHITPDDNPIAGKEATIFIDTKANLLPQDTKKISVRVTNEKGIDAKLTPTVNERLITTKYTFPYQGLYTLDIEIPTNNQVVSYTHTQRVDRGVTRLSETYKPQAWSIALFIGSGLTLIFLIIIVFNRRKEISAQSK